MVSKVPKCITCGKNLRRVSYTYYGRKEPYKGNMICYRKKTNQPSPDEDYGNGITIKGINYLTYDYTLWDGETYDYYLGRYRFCGVNCCAKYGLSKLPRHEKPNATLTKSPFKIYPDIFKRD